MNKKIGSFVLVFALFMGGCTSDGPNATLDKAARALDENNSSMFLQQFDMPVYADNFVRGITRNDSALSSLNELGNLLGLGSLDSLIGSIVDFRAKIEQNFTQGVASGELMAQCKVATTPDCPWYPSSLRKAQVIVLGANAAIAKVTTPARLTSWLALSKEGEQWKIVGTAVMENKARELALKGQQKPAQPAKPANSEKPVNI